MKLSTRGKYGLYAMVYLAQKAEEGPQPLRAIAQLGLPDHYLEQLLGSLRKAGLVTTVRGAQGGYQLAKPPDQISVGHIIDAMEGPLKSVGMRHGRRMRMSPQRGLQNPSRMGIFNRQHQPPVIQHHASGHA